MLHNRLQRNIGDKMNIIRGVMLYEYRQNSNLSIRFGK